MTQSLGHAFDFTTQDPQQPLASKLASSTIIHLKLSGRLSHIRQGVEDIENRNGSQAKRKIQFHRFPQTLLTVHRCDRDLALALPSSLTDLADDPGHRRMDATDRNGVYFAVVNLLRQMRCRVLVCRFGAFGFLSDLVVSFHRDPRRLEG